MRKPLIYYELKEEISGKLWWMQAYGFIVSDGDVVFHDKHGKPSIYFSKVAYVREISEADLPAEIFKMTIKNKDPEDVLFE